MENYALNLYDDKILITLPYSTKDKQEIGFSSNIENIILNVEKLPIFEKISIINNSIKLDTLINFDMRSYKLIKDLDVKLIADIDSAYITDLEISPAINFSNIYIFGVRLITSDNFEFIDSNGLLITAKEVE